VRRDTFQRTSGESVFQNCVRVTGKPPTVKVRENASWSISASQSRSRIAIHWRSRALA